MNKNYFSELTPFYSAAYTRSYLTACYEKEKLEQPNTKGFQTCYSFIYHLKHGQMYCNQAMLSPVELKPMLLFYGLVQFLKSLILTKDASYPSNTSVLAHGVTTRKRKKSGFRFLEDEVKVQKDGLFSHFLYQMFHVKHLPNDKFKMEVLLKQLPDLLPLFETFNHKEYLLKGAFTNTHIVFPSSILDSLHMSTSRLHEYIQYSTLPFTNKKVPITEGRSSVLIPIHKKSQGFNQVNPLLFSSSAEPYLHLKRCDYISLPEILIHYLVLYNLSMICRYETEWWGELLHTFDGNDLPFITRYIELATERIPYLIIDSLRK